MALEGGCTECQVATAIRECACGCGNRLCQERLDAHEYIAALDEGVPVDLDEIATLAEDSIRDGITAGRHATCRFDPATMTEVGVTSDEPICGWTGPAADLVHHGTGDYRCPNGHGGTWLTFHAEDEPALPLEPRWEWSCAVCDGSGDATAPMERCLLCGAKLHKEGSMKYVVIVTEIDQYQNETEVVTEGCRFTTPGDGTLLVLDDRDRQIAAWAKGQWTKVNTRLEGADGA